LKYSGIRFSCNFNQQRRSVMAHISIIGTGNMGQAIAAIAGKGGNSVELLARATPTSR